MSKDGLGGSIDQNFSMPIVNGSGSYNYSTTSFWVTISGYATITGPDEGNWHFVAKDGNNIIFDRQGYERPADSFQIQNRLYSEPYFDCHME